jgi:hypothetical protein
MYTQNASSVSLLSTLGRLTRANFGNKKRKWENVDIALEYVGIKKHLHFLPGVNFDPKIAAVADWRSLY